MRSPRLGRITVTATAGLAVGLLAVGCSSSGSSGSTSSGSSASASPSSAKLEQTSITVGALPVVDSAGLYLANKLGYFKQEGLTVKIDPVTQSTQAIPDMLHGTIAIIGGANYVSFIEAQAKGTAQFKVLAEGVTCKPNTFAVAALPSSGITKPADLAGKTVAVNLTNNIQTPDPERGAQGGRGGPVEGQVRGDPVPEHGHRAQGQAGQRDQRGGAVPRRRAGGGRGQAGRLFLRRPGGQHADVRIPGHLEPGRRRTRTPPRRSRPRCSRPRPTRTRTRPRSSRSCRPTPRSPRRRPTRSR